MRNPRINYVFIDGNNLHLTFVNLGWKLDYRKLRLYLYRRYNVAVAYYFIGYIPKYTDTYDSLKLYGYSLKHRKVSPKAPEYTICPKCGQTYESRKRTVKCDCDADIAMQVMIDINGFNKAILISSDGDFDNVVAMLYQQKKLRLVLAPCREGCSKLLRQAAKEKIGFLDELRAELEKS